MLRSATYFGVGAETMISAQDKFMSTISSLQSAWKGQAAQAAISSAQAAYRNMELTRASATTAQSSSQSYVTQVVTQKAQVAAVPDVDTSWGNALKTGLLGGVVGVGLAKYEQQQKYDRSRDQAAQLVDTMDANGQTQAAQIGNMTWPAGASSTESPQRSLPPVPSSTAETGPSRTNATGSVAGGVNL